jgi:hypothetical protein
MRIIYHCYGSAHSSIVAAAVHLGKLPTNRSATLQEILRLEDFDHARNDSIGHIFFKGRDTAGNEVFTMGMGPENKLVKRSLRSLIKISNIVDHEILFAEALPHINRMAKVGGALSRRYGFVKIGRYLAAYGVCQNYDTMLLFVQETKKLIKNE